MKKSLEIPDLGNGESVRYVISDMLLSENKEGKRSQAF